MNIKFVWPLLLIPALLLISTIAFAQTPPASVKACVNKAGLAFIIGEGFVRKKCLQGEQLLTWGIEGPKGEQGDQGPKGDDGADATHGAGNILFFVEGWDGSGVALRNDGVVYTLYVNSDGTSQWRPTINSSPTYSNVNPPVPVEDIIIWNAGSFIDKNGDVWIYRSNNTWVNTSHP